MDSIKFSILIPTKDRLDLLKDAVKSVINQSYDNWELIISDNCSKADIKSYVLDLKDNRIKYYRQETPVSVTDNWNSANAKATGDYIIMLGDDDAIVPSGLCKLNKIIKEQNNPELIAFCALLYKKPHVDPYNKAGNLLYEVPIREEFGEIALDRRKKIVNDCCSFKRVFAMNMQYYCYKKDLIAKVEEYGDFYEAPYPDYYTTNVMLLLAKSVYYISDIITIIGITASSYGYYYLNNKEKEGMKFHKEEDFRNNTPKYIKDRLCNVDEMSTAGMATFCLVSGRFPDVSIDWMGYYKSVLKREQKWRKTEELKALFEREIVPRVNNNYEEMREYLNELIMQDKRPVNDDRKGTSSYSDINQILKDIDSITDMAGNVGGQFLVVNIGAQKEQLKKLNSSFKLYVWGGLSQYGRRIIELFEEDNIEIAGIIDSYSEMNGVDGMEVYKPEVLKKDNSVVYVATINCYEMIGDTLNHMGYRTQDGFIYNR